ncbi:unnamed protein product [Cylindrotheca closterium]|uniref:DUF6824 domain-containing protein n=1 Tax=Cylindrotheca closterium TaxID=2856 RepID=A0AAD2FS95_9STRA|nr:unnamed protein product [Cylindrotheca closterium]
MKPHHNNNDIQDDVMPQTSTNGRRDEDSTSQSDKSGPAVTEPAARLSGNPQDIICGRGLHIMSHLGNIRLHSIVNRHRQTYQVASRREKAALAQRIVDEIKSTGSRFIRRAGDGRDDEWIEVDNETAYKKVGHALRLRKTFPQQKSPQARPVQEIPQHQDSNIGLSNGTMSTALQQVIGMTVAVPHNVTVHHPFTQPAFSAPDSWHPLLRNQLNPIGPMLGLQHQPQMPSPPAVNEYVGWTRKLLPEFGFDATTIVEPHLTNVLSRSTCTLTDAFI